MTEDLQHKQDLKYLEKLKSENKITQERIYIFMDKWKIWCKENGFEILNKPITAYGDYKSISDIYEEFDEYLRNDETKEYEDEE